MDKVMEDLKKKVRKQRKDTEPLGYSVIKADDMNTAGVLALCGAIFDNARRSYIYDRENKAGIEYFLKTQWAQHLMLGQNIDAQTIIKNWNEQRDYVLWRKRMGCGHCKIKKGGCIHRDSDLHYTAPRNCEKTRRQYLNVDKAV